MITGTIINAAAIVVGGLVGVLINKGIPDRVSNIIFQALGLFSIFLGLSLAFKTQNNYLIIGGDGFVGNYLFKNLKKKNYVKRCF